jgi:MarR family transcriptional regulator, organic hydroperoxide resistance regulator
MNDKTCEALKLDNQLCFAIYSASLAMGKYYKPLLKKLGLTYPQYLIMMVLWEQEGITSTELGKKLQQELGALSPVIRRMENQGLLTRQRSPGDDRKIKLLLTAQGRTLQQQAESVPHTTLCASGLSAEQAMALKQQLDTLRQSLAGFHSPPG